MFDQPIQNGDTSDLIAVLRLTPMTASTRTGTIVSVRALRDALSGGPDIAVDVVTAAIATADVELRARLGKRHSQILSDCRRAERAWNNTPRRDLAMRLRGQIPVLEDAKAAARIAFTKDKAARIANAIDKLAASYSTVPANLAATSIVIEPLLRAAMPETFGVQAAKSLENCRGYVRAAVALVDPDAIQSRISDTLVLPAVWKETLTALGQRIPGHANAVTAIFARISIRADRAGYTPATVPPEFFREFVEYERATKAASHNEKLRLAAKIWNSCLAAREIEASPFEIATNVLRLPDVSWSSVPASVREPFEELTSTLVGSQADQSWGAVALASADQADADLGIAGLGDEPQVPVEDPRDPGTLKNWQDAVKRVWHASTHDSTVERKPVVLEDLFRKDCVIAVIRAIRSARRIRVEATGAKWEEKGRYETSLVQTFLAVGRALGIEEEQLLSIREITYKIDPSIITSKMMPDGSRKFTYEDRKIGPRHAGMLREFSEVAVLGRWLSAPATLTSALAKNSRKRGKDKAPTIAEAALARSVLIAQLAQRVSPLRRTNIARLRLDGDDPHLELPQGPGEGMLRLPACEMKNLRAVTVRIDAGTVEMIKNFRDVYRPVCLKYAKADPENEHLFPGAEGWRKEKGKGGDYAPGFGYLTKEKLNSTFSKHMLKYCMLHMDLHVMRHLAGKIILDQDPSAMSLVQEILGHKNIETTRAYYAEVCQLVAQRRYLDLLDRATRRAIAKVSFTIQLEKELK